MASCYIETKKNTLKITVQVVDRKSNKKESKENKVTGSSNIGALGNAEYPFIAITPRSTLALC